MLYRRGVGGYVCMLLVSCGMFIFSSSLPPLSPHFSFYFPFSLPSFFFLFFYFTMFVFRRMMCTGE